MQASHGDRPEVAPLSTERTASTRRTTRRPLFYGWIILAVTWLVRGLVVGPAYYGWGFLVREGTGMSRALGLSDTQVGLVFTLQRYMSRLLGPGVSLFIRRWGIRRLMAFGAGAGAVGYIAISRANSIWGCLLGFSLLGGIAMGLSGTVCNATLLNNW